MDDKIKTEKLYHVDLDMIELLGGLTPAKRVRRQYPNLSQREINIKVFEEIYKNG